LLLGEQEGQAQADRPAAADDDSGVAGAGADRFWRW
jgi:hypothetical protein